MATANMAEGEKDRAQEELEKREHDLQKAQFSSRYFLCLRRLPYCRFCRQEQSDLQKRLQDLESKVIVGGVNLVTGLVCAWSCAHCVTVA